MACAHARRWRGAWHALQPQFAPDSRLIVACGEVRRSNPSAHLQRGLLRHESEYSPPILHTAIR